MRRAHRSSGTRGPALALVALGAACGRSDAHWRADLAGEADDYRRTLASAALSQPKEIEPAFRALLAAQEDPVRGVRAAAIHALARLAPSALPAWLASDEPVRLSAAGRRGLADALAEADPEVWFAVAEALRGERDPERVLALAPLANRGVAREPALRRLLALAGGEDEALRARALDALRDLGAGPEVLPAVLGVLARPRDASDEARAAALALALRMLAAELGSLEPSERAERVRALGGADELAALCVEGLASSRPETPLFALLASSCLLGCDAPLGAGDPRAEGERGAPARALAALRLARAGDELEEEALLAALAAALVDEAPRVRAAALLALAEALQRGGGARGSAEARAAIEARLLDPVPVVRRAARDARAALEASQR